MEATSEDSPIWLNFISIDPGMANMGHVFGQHIADVDTGVLTIRIDENRMISERVLPTEGLKLYRIYEELKRWKNRNFSEKDLRICRVFIEEQYIHYHKDRFPNNTMKLQLINACLLALFDAEKACFVDLINLSSYKNRLKIATGQHSTNKLKAIDFCKSLLSKEDAEKIGTNDHIADAINQAYFQLKNSHEKTFKKTFKVEVRIEKFSK